MHITSTVILSLSALAPFVQGLGINCRGSSNCAFASKDAMSNIQGKISSIPDSQIYFNGDIIAYDGHISAFLQGTNGPKNAGQIKGYIQALVDHGCKVCGSDPTEHGNNVDYGQFTVNYTFK